MDLDITPVCFRSPVPPCTRCRATKARITAMVDTPSCMMYWKVRVKCERECDYEYEYECGARITAREMVARLESHGAVEAN